MVGCTMLARIHFQLQKLKVKIFIQPFGGLNIMFLGDFMKFPLVNDTLLYRTNI